MLTVGLQTAEILSLPLKSDVGGQKSAVSG